MDPQAWMAANGMTNGMGSALLVPALRLPALPDAVAPAPASQQDSRVPLPASGDDCDVSIDLTAELADIIDDLEEEARPRAQAWRLEQTFESSAEQHFGSQLVEYERNMVKRTQREGKANRAEVTSALETVAANNAQLVAQGNVAFEQRDMALCQTACVEFDGYRAHMTAETQEDIPAHVEARIAEVRDLFRGQFNESARRVEQHARAHCEMFAAALREEAHRELIYIECSNDCWTLCGFLRVSMKSLLWSWLLREMFAENTEEECETVFCATGIKVPYLDESCMSLSGMSSGPHGQTSAPAHEISSANMSNEVCYKSCSLHRSIFSALQRDRCVCFDSHSGSPADLTLCIVNCSGNSSQFCGGDSWYTFHLMYLRVAPVEVICSGMPEPFGNNMPTYTTICLDYFIEKRLASHEPVCDFLLRKWVVRQRCFEIKYAGVSHVACKSAVHASRMDREQLV